MTGAEGFAAGAGATSTGRAAVSPFGAPCARCVAHGTSTKEPTSYQVRSIALDDVALELLARAARVPPRQTPKPAAYRSVTRPYLWSTYVDGRVPRTANSLTRAFDRLCKTMESEAAAAGSSESWLFRFHDLRQLSAAQMAGSVWDVRTVAARLGHSDT